MVAITVKNVEIQTSTKHAWGVPQLLIGVYCAPGVNGKQSLHTLQPDHARHFPLPPSDDLSEPHMRFPVYLSVVRGKLKCISLTHHVSLRFGCAWQADFLG